MEEKEKNIEKKKKMVSEWNLKEFTSLFFISSLRGFFLDLVWCVFRFFIAMVKDPQVFGGTDLSQDVCNIFCNVFFLHIFYFDLYTLSVPFSLFLSSSPSVETEFKGIFALEIFLIKNDQSDDHIAMKHWMGTGY